jgi:hypothetical protein
LRSQVLLEELEQSGGVEVESSVNNSKLCAVWQLVFGHYLELASALL